MARGRGPSNLQVTIYVVVGIVAVVGGVVVLAELIGGPLSHGAIFNSGDIAPGESFSWDVGTEYEGTTIPYHCHYHADAGMVGTIEVTESYGVMVELHTAISMSATNFEPSEMTTSPGAIVTWTNNSSAIHTVTSGER